MIGARSNDCLCPMRTWTTTSARILWRCDTTAPASVFDRVSNTYSILLPAVTRKVGKQLWAIRMSHSLFANKRLCTVRIPLFDLFVPYYAHQRPLAEPIRLQYNQLVYYRVKRTHVRFHSNSTFFISRFQANSQKFEFILSVVNFSPRLCLPTTSTAL